MKVPFLAYLKLSKGIFVTQTLSIILALCYFLEGPKAKGMTDLIL